MIEFFNHIKLHSKGSDIALTNVDDDISQTVTVTAPTISISLLDTSMEIGDSDQFTISATGLSSSVSYNIRVEAGSSSTLKFNSCAGTNSTDSVEFDAGSGNLSYTVNNVTLYACAAGSDTLTATLLSGTNTVDTDTRSVTVTAVPRILSVAKPSGTSGTLEIEYSVPKAPGYYQIDILSSETETGHYARVRIEKPSRITSIPAGDKASLTSAMLITGKYYKAKVRVCDTSSYDDDDCGAYSSLSDPVLPGTVAVPSLSLSQIEHQGPPAIATVRVENLDGSRSYTVRLSTSATDVLKIDSCTGKASSDSKVFSIGTSAIPDDGTFQWIVNVHGCAAGTDTLTVTLRSGSTDVAASSRSITVTDPPRNLRANGDSTGFTAGRAVVRWDGENPAQTYKVRYARECINPDDDQGIGPCSPLPQTWTTPASATSTDNSITIQQLALETLYRVQVKEVARGDTNQTGPTPYSSIQPTPPTRAPSGP